MGLVSKIQLVIGLQSIQLYIVIGLIRRNKQDRRIDIEVKIEIARHAVTRKRLILKSHLMI